MCNSYVRLYARIAIDMTTTANIILILGSLGAGSVLADYVPVLTLTRTRIHPERTPSLRCINNTKPSHWPRRSQSLRNQQ
jgi:hypothetical protein